MRSAERVSLWGGKHGWKIAHRPEGFKDRPTAGDCIDLNQSQLDAGRSNSRHEACEKHNDD
jgi:hypothetical protein